MPEEREQRLKTLLDAHAQMRKEHVRTEQEKQDFMKRYADHKKAVIIPALKRYQSVLSAHGHRLEVEDVGGTASEIANSDAVLAVVLMDGELFRRPDSPLLVFWGVRETQLIATQMTKRMGGARRAVPGPRFTIEDLTSDKVEELLLEVLESSLK